MNDEIARTADMVMSITAEPVRAGPLRLSMVKGRGGRTMFGPSGPLIVQHGTTNDGRYFALVEFENRPFWVGEFSPLILWCREQFDGFEMLSSLMFVFQNENDQMAFKMRWAGMTSQELMCLPS